MVDELHFQVKISKTFSVMSIGKHHDWNTIAVLETIN